MAVYFKINMNENNSLGTSVQLVNWWFEGHLQ